MALMATSDSTYGSNQVLASRTSTAVNIGDGLNGHRRTSQCEFRNRTGFIEVSTDLSEWTTIETDIIGESAVVTRYYSIENQPKRFFRARRN